MVDPAARLVLACAVAVAALAACRREEPHVKADEDPPPVKLVVDPPPSGMPAFTATAAPRAAVASTEGRRAGDHVRVRWGGTCYAARITSVASPGAYRITYDGYSHAWDETIGESRICK